MIDDGSSDGTLEQLRELSAEVPFMRVLKSDRDRRSDGPDRLAHAPEVRNFNAALATVDWRQYTHVMKLDGDVELPPNYLSVVLARFAADSRLGLAGGVLMEPAAAGGPRIIPIPRHHVHGAVKCYSRACFTAIRGIQERLGWDTIDETYARMSGFATRSFPEIVAVHHRPWGSADGVLRGLARHGECAYITHYQPLWVALRSLKLARNRPRALSGAAFLYGYVRAAARHTDRVSDSAYRDFTRRELRRRMLGHVARTSGM